MAISNNSIQEKYQSGELINSNTYSSKPKIIKSLKDSSPNNKTDGIYFSDSESQHFFQTNSKISPICSDELHLILFKRVKEISEVYAKSHLDLSKFISPIQYSQGMEPKLLKINQDVCVNICSIKGKPGTFRAKLQIEVEPFLYQSPVGFMTQTGIVSRLSLISKSNTKKHKLELFIKLKEKVQLFENCLPLLLNRDKDKPQALQMEVYLLENLILLSIDIRRTEITFNTGFIYPDIDSLQGFQIVFIKLAKSIWDFVSIMLSSELNLQFVVVLKEILIREEFELPNLTVKVQGIERQNKQIEIAVEYLKLINTFLNSSFNILETNLSNEKKKEIIGFVIAFIFLRVPIFQTRLLEIFWHSILEENNLKIQHWNSITKKWDSEFFDVFKFQSQEFISELFKCGKLISKNWEFIFQNKNLIFFHFANQYLYFIQNKYMLPNNIYNSYFPGFDTLLSIISQETQNKPSSQFSSNMVECQSLYFFQSKTITEETIKLIKKTKCHKKSLRTKRNIQFIGHFRKLDQKIQKRTFKFTI